MTIDPYDWLAYRCAVRRGLPLFFVASLCACAPEPLLDPVTPSASAQPFASMVSVSTQLAARALTALREEDRSEILLVFEPSSTIERFEAKADTLQKVQALEVGLGPRAIVTADLDGDASLEVVTANAHDRSLTRLGRAEDGALEARNTVTLEGTPVHLSAADLNADGKDELIVTEGLRAEESALEIWGLAAGGMERLSGPLFVEGLTLTAAGDISEDHRSKIIVLQAPSNTLSLVDGDDRPITASAQSTCAEPASVRVGDINRDGLGDVVVPCHSGGVDVFLGPDASGARWHLPGGDNLYDLVVEDLDGDGGPDLAAVDVSQHEVLLWFSPADDQAPSASLPVGRGPIALATLDLGADRDSDLVVLSFESRELDVLASTTTGGE